MSVKKEYVKTVKTIFIFICNNCGTTKQLNYDYKKEFSIPKNWESPDYCPNCYPYISKNPLELIEALKIDRRSNYANNTFYHIVIELSKKIKDMEDELETLRQDKIS